MAYLGLSDHEVKAFSVVRAIRALYYPEVRQYQKEAAFEIDVSAEAARQDDRHVGGVLIPDDVLNAKQIQRRVLTAGSPAGGGRTIDDEMQSMIDIFIEHTFAAENVSVLTGITGTVYLPGQEDRVDLYRGAYTFNVATFNTTLANGTKSWTFTTASNVTKLSFESITAADTALIKKLEAGDQIRVLNGTTTVQTWTIDSVDVDDVTITLASGSVTTGLTDGDDYTLRLLAVNKGWTPETGAAREDEMSFRQVKFTPHHVRSYTRVTKQLLVQSHTNIEMLIRKDLARAIAKSVDKAILYGVGTDASKDPIGISKTDGINKDTWTVAETKAARRKLIDKVLDAEELLANNNVPDQNGRQIERERMCQILMSPRMRRRMKTVQFFGDNTDNPLLSDDEMLLGEYKTHISSQVEHDDFFFCDWKDAVLALWTGIEIMENPYSEDREGIIRITTDQMLDVNVLRPKSFYWLDAA